MELLYQPWQDFSFLLPPSDLMRFLDGMAWVARYQDRDYPPGVIQNNLLQHVRRSIAIATMLPMEVASKERLLRMLWVHDLAETVDVKDATMYAKLHDPVLSRSIREQEVKFIRKELTLSDRRLFRAYCRTSEYLKKGNGRSVELDPVAVLAKVIDIAEGSTFYHYTLSQWAATPEFHPAWLPPDQKLTFGLRLNLQVRDRLKRLPREIGVLPLQLLEEAMAADRSFWFDRPPLSYPYQYISDSQPYVPPPIAQILQSYPPVGGP